MTKQDREYLDLLIAGLHASIMANQDLQKIKDENIEKQLQEVIALQKITNGRVNTLEKESLVHIQKCPNVKAVQDINKKIAFWVWFSAKPVRLVLFFGIIILGSNIVKYPAVVEWFKSILKLI